MQFWKSTKFLHGYSVKAKAVITVITKATKSPFEEKYL